MRNCSFYTLYIKNLILVKLLMLSEGFGWEYGEEITCWGCYLKNYKQLEYTEGIEFTDYYKRQSTRYETAR